VKAVILSSIMLVSAAAMPTSVSAAAPGKIVKILKPQATYFNFCIFYPRICRR
jgi:hypothetical protein